MLKLPFRLVEWKKEKEKRKREKKSCSTFDWSALGFCFRGQFSTLQSLRSVFHPFSISTPFFHPPPFHLTLFPPHWIVVILLISRRTVNLLNRRSCIFIGRESSSSKRFRARFLSTFLYYAFSLSLSLSLSLSSFFFLLVFLPRRHLHGRRCFFFFTVRVGGIDRSLTSSRLADPRVAWFVSSLLGAPVSRYLLQRTRSGT